jgi:hypothetical protein
MAWAHNFKPPSGIPARGGIGTGDGWGGAAKGAGRGGPARPFQAGNVTRVSFHTGQGDPAKAEKRRALLAEQEARNQQMIDLLYELALNATREETQLSAAVAALDRLEGKPVRRSKNVNFDAGPSLEELILAAQAPKPASS